MCDAKAQLLFQKHTIFFSKTQTHRSGHFLNLARTLLKKHCARGIQKVWTATQKYVFCFAVNAHKKFSFPPP